MIEDDQRSESEVEQEIREGRKFTPEEALARMAGPGSMKGGNPVPRTQQAEAEIATWLRSHLTDGAGALQVLLNRQLQGSRRLLDKLDDPLTALAEHCGQLLGSDHLLRDLVRQADAEWGRRMDERPYFDREGHPQHPSDPYTVNSVRKVLEHVLEQLQGRPADGILEP
jgi:hypothetical protein